MLIRYHPGSLEVFSSLTCDITLAFIQAYPAPDEAGKLTWSRCQAFGRAHRYPSSRNLALAFAHLQAPHPQASPETMRVYQAEALLLAGLLRQTLQQKKTALRELTGLFNQHPDREIFGSLPGAGDYLGPALLAHFGDDRRRFRTAASVQALAGTCPVTRSSGKRRIVRFRHACDREFRQIAQQWARASLKTSAWACAYYSQLRPRCRLANQAYRRLANRWLCVAWRLWQTHQPYDETYHHQERILRSQPTP